MTTQKAGEKPPAAVKAGMSPLAYWEDLATSVAALRLARPSSVAENAVKPPVRINKKMVAFVATRNAGEAFAAAVDAGMPHVRVREKIAAPMVPQKVGEMFLAGVDTESSFGKI